MTNEFDNVLDGVDLGGDAEDLPTDDGDGQTPNPAEVGKDKADQPDADAGEDLQEDLSGSEETPERPAKVPDKRKGDAVPLPKFMAERRANRELRLRLAQYEAERTIPAPQPQAPAGKSPMDTFIEAEGEDAVPPAKVLRDQAKWDRDQAQTRTAADTDTVANRAVNVAAVSMTDDVMGEGLGMESLLMVGRQFLTKGDIVDIRDAGADAGKMMYRRLLERTVQSGTPQGNLVRAAYRKAQQERQAGTGKQPAVGKKPTPPIEAPSREEVLTPPGAIHGAGDLTDFYLGDME